MSNRLYLHRGAEPITAAELSALEAPAPTDTWHPLHHYDFVCSVRDTLHFMGASITSESYGIKPGDTGGDQFFGLIELTHPELYIPTGDSLGLGFRNSWDKTFAGSGILARHTFVCDNLAFAGTDAFKFNRKNTPSFARDLPAIMAQAMMNFLRSADQFMQQQSNFSNVYLHEVFGNDDSVTVDHVSISLAEAGAITWTNVRHLIHEIKRPDGPGGFFPRENRDIHFGDVLNAVTEVEKRSLNPISTPTRMSIAHNTIAQLAETV